MAASEGFEPLGGIPQRFARPPHSTASANSLNFAILQGTTWVTEMVVPPAHCVTRGHSITH